MFCFTIKNNDDICQWFFFSWKKIQRYRKVSKLILVQVSKQTFWHCDNTSPLWGTTGFDARSDPFFNVHRRYSDQFKLWPIKQLSEHRKLAKLPSWHPQVDDTRLLQLNNGKTEILIFIIGEDPIFQISNSLGSLSDSVTHQKAQKLELLNFGMTCRRRSGLLPQFHLLSHFFKNYLFKTAFGWL